MRVYIYLEVSGWLLKIHYLSGYRLDFKEKQGALVHSSIHLFKSNLLGTVFARSWDFCLPGDLCLVGEREMYIKILILCNKCNTKSRNRSSANLHLTTKDLFVVFSLFKRIWYQSGHQ